MRKKTKEILEDRLFTAGVDGEGYAASEPEVSAGFAELVETIEKAIASGKLCRGGESVLLG